MAMIGSETHRLRQSMGLVAPPRPALLKDAPRAAPGGVSARVSSFSATSVPVVLDDDDDEEADNKAAAARADAFFATALAGTKRSASDAAALSSVGMGAEARVTLTVGGETGFGSPAALMGPPPPPPPPGAPEKPIKRARRIEEVGALEDENETRRALGFTGTGEGAGDEQE
jgi:hypothetical protein